VHRLLTSLIIITFLHILSFIDFLANLNPEKGSRAIKKQEEEEDISVGHGRCFGISDTPHVYETWTLSYVAISMKNEYYLHKKNISIVLFFIRETC